MLTPSESPPSSPSSPGSSAEAPAVTASSETVPSASPPYATPCSTPLSRLAATTVAATSAPASARRPTAAPVSPRHHPGTVGAFQDHHPHPHRRGLSHGRLRHVALGDPVEPGIRCRPPVDPRDHHQGEEPGQE